MATYTCPVIDENAAGDILKGVSIPPRPTLLIEVNRHLQSSDPSPSKLSEIIVKDVAISAAMLKTVNSPLFGLRGKISEIKQAVVMLGATNVRNIVTGLVLRNTLAGNNAMSLERFWDSSEKVADIAMRVCNSIPRAPKDQAFTFGIFRDCGIPILMQRFPDYRETLKVASGDDRELPFVEDERHGTNHVIVGYLVAKSWGLSPVLCEAIQRHHDAQIFQENDSSTPIARTLVAVNYLAEHLYDKQIRLRHDAQWEQIGDTVLNYLGLTNFELEELQEDVSALYG